MTSHSTVFCVWVSVPLPQFLQIVCRFITSICSFFCQINETKVQNKIYFDKTFKCWFVCGWKSGAFANVLMFSSITTEPPREQTRRQLWKRGGSPLQFNLGPKSWTRSKVEYCGRRWMAVLCSTPPVSVIEPAKTNNSDPLAVMRYLTAGLTGGVYQWNPSFI